MVIEKALAGPIGIFVKFSTLQEYGVDKVFFLENANVDSSQKNVVFLTGGEDALRPLAVAGMYVLSGTIDDTNCKGAASINIFSHFFALFIYHRAFAWWIIKEAM